MVTQTLKGVWDWYTAAGISTAECGTLVLKKTTRVPIWNSQPQINRPFREKLLECYLKFSDSSGLSNWLKDLNQDPKGSVEQKKERIRQHTQYLTMPPETFPDQTIAYLQQQKALDDHLDICEVLGLSLEGKKDVLFMRIFREIGYQEGWLRPFDKDREEPKFETVLPYVQWHPALLNSAYEKDYYENFVIDMTEAFGKENVFSQMAVAHGNSLKIDFHIGTPNNGVGIEFKTPKNNSALQQARGQLEEYQAKYSSNMIVVIINDFLEEGQNSAKLRHFEDSLKEKKIGCVVKSYIK